MYNQVYDTTHTRGHTHEKAEGGKESRSVGTHRPNQKGSSVQESQQQVREREAREQGKMSRHKCSSEGL